MHNVHSKNTVRYYILIVIALAFLFFSNDFGLLDVQKTAIVMAAGIDREDDEFIITSQIAIPQSSKQGKVSESVQIVSRGKTVADAFEEINAKTGWYPKLVFCNLILIGQTAAKRNVFDALDYFLRDEYLSDNCLVATCEGNATDLLNTTALVDPSGSIAMEKVLSKHAERVGTVLPTTLREFSIGYFSDSRSGFMPILKTQPQQEQIGKIPPSADNSSSSSDNNSDSSNTQSGSQNNQGGENQRNQNKPVFSASETALFVEGKHVATLTREETFAFGAVTNKLRLASYSVEQSGRICTLTVKHNSPKIKLSVGTNERAVLKIDVTMAAGKLDYSVSENILNISDVGDVPNGLFSLAEKKLSAEIHRVFEKCRACRCDLFGIVERLEKYEKKSFISLQDNALDTAISEIKVHFHNIR